MGITGSLVLLAIGAILAFAVEFDAEGINLNTVGVILMVVGIIGALMSLMFWSSWGGWGSRRETVVRDRDVVRDREVI